MKKSSLIVFFALMSQSAFAFSVKSISLSVPELKYSANKGTGTLNSLVVNLDAQSSEDYIFQTVPTVLSPAKIEFSREDKTFKINIGPVALAMQNINALLTKLNTLSLSKLDVAFGEKKQHAFRIGAAELSHTSIGDFMVEDLKLNCTHKQTDMPDIQGLLDECLIKSTLQAERLEIPDMNNFWVESLFNVTPWFEELFQAFKDFEMQMAQGNFDMSLKVKGLPFARVKGEGHLKPELAAKKVTIRIDKIKFGLLPVTDLVMSQLKKKLPPENFRVEPPYIYATW
jgi:hypothetical protein